MTETYTEIAIMVIWGEIILFSTVFLLVLVIEEINRKNIPKMLLGTLGLFNFLTISCVPTCYFFKEIIRNYFSLSEYFYSIGLNATEDFLNTFSIILFYISLIEKKISLLKPEKHVKIFTMKKAVATFLILFFYDLSLSVFKNVPFSIDVKKNGSDHLNETNFTTPSYGNPIVPYSYLFLFHSFLAFYPFMFLIFFTYWKIYRYFKIKNRISDTFNKESEKGFNKNYIKLLFVKVVLIFSCKLPFIVYKTFTLFSDKSELKSDQLEIFLKVLGWGFTGFMFFDYLFQIEYFRKLCQKISNFFCFVNLREIIKLF